MVKIDEFIAEFASFVWGLPLLILLTGGGLYLMIISKFLPFRYLGHSIQVLRGKYDDPNDPGEISHFKALSTALASTIGMGNIAGVAVAIAIGGRGGDVLAMGERTCRNGYQIFHQYPGHYVQGKRQRR